MNRFLIIITLFVFAALARDSTASIGDALYCGARRPRQSHRQIIYRQDRNQGRRLPGHQRRRSGSARGRESKTQGRRGRARFMGRRADGASTRFCRRLQFARGQETSAALVRWRPRRSGRRCAGADFKHQRSEKRPGTAILVRSRNAFLEGCLDDARPDAFRQRRRFIAIFVQIHGDKVWKLFEDLARNGLSVPGPNNAALNPVLTGAKKGTIAGVDYITFGQIAKGEKLAIHYPKEGTVVALRPAFVQQGAPHREEARKLVDFMLSEEGQDLVAKTFLIPARSDIRSQRPALGEFKMLAPDWAFVEKSQTQLVERFRKQIVEQIIQKR